MIKALHYPRDAMVRRAAAEALGEVGDRQVPSLLVTAMAEDVCPVAGAAAVALSALDGKGYRVPVEQLIGALRSSRRWHERGDRVCGCRYRNSLIWKGRQLVHRHAGRKHVPLMLKILKDRDPHLREFAAKTLEAIGDPSAVRPLLERLRREDCDEVPHRVVFDAILSFKQPSTLPALMHWVANYPPLLDNGDLLGFRGEVDALGRLGAPGLEERLATLIADRKCPRQREILIETVRDGPMERWRTPGHHFDVRGEMGIGTYFEVTVNDQGIVEFGWETRCFPAAPDGWWPSSTTSGAGGTSTCSGEWSPLWSRNRGCRGIGSA
ncbi:MAG: hypothetical protein GEV11_29260 [Streptosporangiales bacterium]|nr:hypothetical protein [Streptosporangiales bacterium]